MANPPRTNVVINTTPNAPITLLRMDKFENDIVRTLLMLDKKLSVPDAPNFYSNALRLGTVRLR
jgi:hypothetical protein